MCCPCTTLQLEEPSMRALTLLAVCVAGFATIAAAQHPAAPPAAPAAAKLAAAAGTWTFENNVKNAAGQDTVVSSEVTVSADARTWMTHLAGRDPVPTRVVAMAGDSVVTESGPFQSVARPGQTVTTHETFHFKGDVSWGSIEARYSNGDVVKGSFKGTRKQSAAPKPRAKRPPPLRWRGATPARSPESTAPRSGPPRATARLRHRASGTALPRRRHCGAAVATHRRSTPDTRAKLPRPP